jgi:hypothetical protein
MTMTNAQRQAKYVAANREKVNAQNKAALDASPERRARKAERKAEWYQETRDVRLKAVADWRKDNKDRVLASVADWRSRNPDKFREIARRYYANNKASCIAQVKKYKVSKRNAIPAWANLFFMQEAYSIAALRTKVTGVDWHVDHIVPLHSDIVCGLHCEANLQVITAQENMAKGNRHWPNMPEVHHA